MQNVSKESELTVDFQNGTRLKWRGSEVPSSLYQLITSLTVVRNDRDIAINADLFVRYTMLYTKII